MKKNQFFAFWGAVFTMSVLIALVFGGCDIGTNREPATVNALNLTGMVTAPVTGATPSTAAINHTQYTGTIAWQTSGGGSVSGNFAASTVYRAVVTLTAKTDFTFTGIAANCFVHTGATSVTNSADSGIVTITFPQTGGSQPTGNGTASNPYRIYTKAQFMAIAGGVSTYQKYYRLEADLVGAESITAPQGDSSTSGCFVGNFDGNGHTINLNISGSHESAGLFARIGGGAGVFGGWDVNPGTVKNLKLTGTVDVTGRNAGAVAGTISDVGSSASNIASSVNVTVSGPDATSVGGIAGNINAQVGTNQSAGKIEHCYSTGNVTITNTDGYSVYAGGIVGSANPNITVSYCWASGIVMGSSNTRGGMPGYAGGIAGYTSQSTVSNCVALSPSVVGDTTMNIGSIVGGTWRIGSALGTLANNYANSTMTVNYSTVSGNDLTGSHGADVTVTATELADGNWWENTAEWSGKFGTGESAPWKWDSTSNRPVLWFE